MKISPKIAHALDQQIRSVQDQIKIDPISIFKPAKVIGGAHAKRTRVAQDTMLEKQGFYELAEDSLSCGGFVDNIEGVSFIGYAALSMFEQNPLNQIIIKTMAEEATRKWVELRSDEDISAGYLKDLQSLIDDEDQYNLRALLTRCCELVSSHGGCCLYIDMGVDEKENEFPLVLTPETIKRGSLKGFRLLEPFLVYPAPYNAYNPLREDYFNPEYYFVQGGIKVHKSRLIRFVNGNISYLLKPAYNFFGIPLSQLTLKYVQGFERTDEAVLHIIENFSMTGLSTNMSQVLNSGGMSDQQACEAVEDLRQRVQIFLAQKRLNSLQVIDKNEEEFFQINTPLAGLHDMSRLKLELLALVNSIPVSRLFGSPSPGFNATGEAEQENWMDKVKTFRNRTLCEPYKIIRKVVELSEYGKYTKEIEEYWAPVMEANEVQQAQVNYTNAQTTQIYVDSGIISRNEARSVLISDKKSNYAALPTEIPQEDIDQQIEQELMQQMTKQNMGDNEDENENKNQ